MSWQRWSLQLALAWVVACGPPPATRAERTVHAPVFAAHGAVRSEALLRQWLEPLRTRQLDPLLAACRESCQLTWMREAAPEVVRRGRAQLRGWLQGQLLSRPYAAVRPVYLGPSARPGVEVADVELLDACDRVSARVTAKLWRGDDGSLKALQVRVREERLNPCYR